MHIDTLALGNIKAGVETLSDVARDGELGVALTWFAAIPVFEEKAAFVHKLEGVAINDTPLGTWIFGVHIEGANKTPDPAQIYVLKRDGQDLWDVACALEREPTQSPMEAARYIAAALIIKSAGEKTDVSWSFPTPLGQTFHIRAVKESQSEPVAALEA